jgi:arginase/N-omega-hydroxy-L-arginine amidinohydrolase
VTAIFEALPPERSAGIELAEFEAGDDEARNAQATAIILDTVAPLFAGGRQSKQESGGKA